MILKARQQLPDADIVRANAIHGGKGSVQHMVTAVKIMHALNGGYVPRVAHHADLAVAAAFVGTDITQFAGCVIAAYRTVANGLASLVGALANSRTSSSGMPMM